MTLPEQARSRNGFGIAALVLGLLAVLLFWTIILPIIFGLLALIFGLVGRARVKRGQATNGRMALAGVLLGLLGLIIVGAIIAFSAWTLQSPEGQRFLECVEQAGEDQEQMRQCVEQFIDRDTE